MNNERLFHDTMKLIWAFKRREYSTTYFKKYFISFKHIENTVNLLNYN